MASSMTASPATASKSSAKSSKMFSKIIRLSLSPDKLRNFPHEPLAVRKTSTSSNTIAGPSPSNNPSDSNAATPTPAATATAATTTTSTNGTLAPPTAPGRRKGIPGPKPGSKRGPPLVDGQPKPRGKPGPKKKPRLDPSHPDYVPGPAPAVKLGPKANQGAINAGLRALDRTGKPCRKWARTGFKLKSFTGVEWQAPSWKAPRQSAFSEDVKSDSNTSSETKPNLDSSAIASEKSINATEVNTPNPPTDLVSSPAPAPTPASATVAAA
ncbi:DUF1711-domain-containing protein [Aulographum hederae CBS 113979]|uniref:DUF1711-domain-containing protein n=1 Tax=Aulographum hederae CBS 113979 TaxID=1176131 RepID=A0A6G1GY70_9PEZI|nr:DUF1711-domain-containing protein [Aulographum hederae CBS 113979]